MPDTFDNLVLIGFPTAGKSTQARLFAKRWGWRLMDTDELIAGTTGRKPGDIIAQDGEEAFRRIETETLQRFVDSGPRHHVVSTGGGLVSREENWPLIRRLGPVIALLVKPETAVYRQANASHRVRRPLLEGDDPARKARELMERRMPYYGRAEFQLHTDGMTKDAVQNELVSLLATRYRLPN
ncbi:MAG: shikimate kinase [Deltaproteobacteria bacterium]|nr:shikimate kinase [Deltaproteobacteria bacterium]